jgi:hypothetical protein
MSDMKTKWSLEADFLQACNCDYGCPCEFSAPPTRGFCEGTGAWSIVKGHFGDVNLDGIGVGFAAHWPKAIHEGGGTLALFIDERATPQQREAILTICSGKAGGMPFEILAQTFSKVLEPVFAPIQFRMNGRDSSVHIGSHLNVELEPMGVVHGTGFIFKNAEAVSGKVCRVEVPGLKFDWPHKAGFFTRVNYAN